MKKCPTCEKTFDDALRFCQTDGTPLLEINESAPEDPYKTTVGRQGDFASATPSDPFKTMVAGSLKNDDPEDLLQLPEENQDPLKTMFISDEEMKKELSVAEPEKEKIIEIQPLNDVSSSSSEKNDSIYTAPTPPVFNEPSLSPPNFGDLSPASQSESLSSSESQPENFSSPFSDSSSKGIPSPFDQKPPGSNIKSPFESSPFSQPSAPIPSPFSDAKPTSYNPPSAPLPTYKEPEPASYEQNNPFSQTPFGQSAVPVNEPLQKNEWTPPPAPESSWQNQEIGANTPFQPPASGTGQNQTLAIVSLVLGIIGIVLCQLTAPAAIVTGFMARKKAAENPADYGGGALALAGIITGVIGTLLLVLVIIYFIFIFGLVASQAF